MPASNIQARQASTLSASLAFDSSSNVSQGVKHKHIATATDSFIRKKGEDKIEPYCLGFNTCVPRSS